MPSWQSIRFRLSIQYSALVFGIGGGLLAILYFLNRRWLQSQTMMAQVVTGQRVVLVDGSVVVMPQIKEVEARAIESIYNEIVLDRVAKTTLVAIGALFLLSIVVGWIMSGRVLKPVAEITSVAREIQASDLSRRIDLDGPDDEIKQLGDTFDQMLERLETAFSSQRQFLADTSHDLRTPLTVIRSNVELVADDPSASEDDWRAAGSAIRRNAERMSQMIEELLDTARLQAGRAQSVTLNLADLVEAKVSDLSAIAGERQVRVVGRPHEAVVLGVEVALDRALTNLVDNAVAASPPDSEVLVASGVSSGWAWLAVDDSGPGLPDDPGDRVGLGLSIVNQIADGHGGQLATFAGTNQSGTTMVVWLPTEETSVAVPTSNPLHILDD